MKTPLTVFRLPNLHSDSIVELGRDGDAFFRNMFTTYDKDRDGVLSTSELDEFFQIMAASSRLPPLWGDSYYKMVRTNDRGYINLQGFLSLWKYVL
jgi:Ca2+-binding EF-hand superfamily protein